MSTVQAQRREALAPPVVHSAPATTLPPTESFETPDRPYPGDTRALIFWFICAGLLVALHVGQHLVYLLR